MGVSRLSLLIESTDSMIVHYKVGVDKINRFNFYQFCSDARVICE